MKSCFIVQKIELFAKERGNNMDIIELIKKIEQVSKKIEGKSADECRLIMIDQLIKLEYKINDLEDELKYSFEKIYELKNRDNKNKGEELIDYEQLKEENEFLMRENLKLIMKLNTMNQLKSCNNF